MANTVSDQRRKNFYMTENAVIDYYAKILGPMALAVYHVMVRRCDGQSRQVKISNRYLADVLGVDQKSIKRGIAVLVEHKLIHRESGKQDGTFNRYILRTVAPPKASESAPLFEGGGTNTDYPPCDTSETKTQPEIYNEDTGGWDKYGPGGGTNTAQGWDKYGPGVVRFCPRATY